MGWMMGRMRSQPVLPMLPAGAEEIAPGVGLVTGPDGGLVVVHGLATFAWDAADEAGPRRPAGQLVPLGPASPGHGAPLPGAPPAPFLRGGRALAAGGGARPPPAPRGPDGRAQLQP